MQLMSAAIVAMVLAASGSARAASTARSGPAGVVEVTGPAAVPLTAVQGRPVDAPYQAPLGGGLRVRTPFNPPADRYGRGHLGVDLAASAGVAVLAAGAATVRFAGPVAGRGVVVLVHPDGVSTEYEPVAAVVAAGQRVLAGQRIGVLRGAHRSCAPATCLHWGARRGEAYLDPMSLLRPLGVVRLLPWN
jgi:murein DD-endopeptidase MepM/ murein hydrolase activator NlpD